MIKSIGIIGGSGQMGKMFAPLFKAKGIEVLVSDKSSQYFESELIARSEAVIISVPIDQTESVVDRISPLLRQNQLLSDFCSVKSSIIPKMLKTKACVISSHPMFGQMSDITRQNIILLPVRAGNFLAIYQMVYQALGLNVVVMEDWKKHDESMSFIQGLMHFFHIMFTQTMRSKAVDLSTLLSICSPVYQANFAFACRILQRDPHLYTHILMDNPENISVLKHFVEQAQQSIQMLQNKDERAFMSQFLENRAFLGDHGKEFSDQSDYLVEKMKQYKV